MIKVGDPVMCPDGTWFVHGALAPCQWGSSEATILSTVSARVGSVDRARSLMSGAARRWEELAGQDPELHRALVRRLTRATPAPTLAPPAEEEDDDQDDAPMSAMEETMEVQEVAAEAPTPAPEVSAPQASTQHDERDEQLDEDATCEDCALAEGLCVICAEREAAVALSLEESAQSSEHPAYQWMTAIELAPLMQVERSTLRLWAKGGKLEVRDAPAGRARGPKAKEYRIPLGQPVPSPGPQARSVTGTPPRPDTRDRGSVQPADHPAYQWTKGSRAMGDVLGVDVGTVFAWAKSGKLESRTIEGNQRDHEWRVPPGQPVPVPLITGGRARQAPQPSSPALSPSRIEEETRLHAQLTAARSRCAELDAQIEALTAQLAQRDEALREAERRHARTRASMEAADLQRAAGEVPASLRSVLDEVARWAGCAVISLDIRLETGARIGVAP